MDAYISKVKRNLCNADKYPDAWNAFFIIQLEVSYRSEASFRVLVTLLSPSVFSFPQLIRELFSGTSLLTEQRWSISILWLLSSILFHYPSLWHEMKKTRGSPASSLIASSDRREFGIKQVDRRQSQFSCFLWVLSAVNLDFLLLRKLLESFLSWQDHSRVPIFEFQFSLSYIEQQSRMKEYRISVLQSLSPGDTEVKYHRNLICYFRLIFTERNLFIYHASKDLVYLGRCVAHLFIPSLRSFIFLV